MLLYEPCRKIYIDLTKNSVQDFQVVIIEVFVYKESLQAPGH